MGLVFSIAFDGYENIRHDFVQSHDAYTLPNGYSYLLIGQGASNPEYNSWLKIALIISALDAGHEWVMYVSESVKFTEHAPRFETMVGVDTDVSILEHQPEFAGPKVIIVRNSFRSYNLLCDILFKENGTKGRFSLIDLFRCNKCIAELPLACALEQGGSTEFVSCIAGSHIEYPYQKRGSINDINNLIKFEGSVEYFTFQLLIEKLAGKSVV